MSLYKEIKNLQPETSQCFWAFSPTQYAEGIKNKNLKDKKILNGGSGLYGTKEGLDAMYQFYEDLHERIKNECDPQEVYEHEFWNHESEYLGSDTQAIKIVIDYFGEEKARTVKRKFALY